MIIHSSCPDNDDTACSVLAGIVSIADGEELEAMRAAGRPVRRASDGALAYQIGSAPGLVALVMADCDTKILMPSQAFEEQWEEAR